jgi:hypothetical protein
MPSCLLVLGLRRPPRFGWQENRQRHSIVAILDRDLFLDRVLSSPQSVTPAILEDTGAQAEGVHMLSLNE